MKKLISIICPVYNEELNIEALYLALCEAMAPEEAHYNWELIFTDNHSTDNTFALLEALARRDSRVRVFRFSRNFGFQMSIYTGYMKCKGAAAVQIDADLQDPPSLIPSFLRLWEQGNQVVYGVRRTRQEGALMNAARKAFYRLLDRISETHLPHDAGDFRLIDRRIIDELAKIHDPNIYVRGRIAEMGFSQVGVIYDRHARAAGVSKFRFYHNMRVVLDAVTSHSAFPLRLASYFGFAMAAVSMVAVCAYLVDYFASNNWPRGIATMLIVQLMSLSVLSLFLGILGEYVSRLFDQMKKSPLAIIETQLGNDH